MICSTIALTPISKHSVGLFWWKWKRSSKNLAHVQERAGTRDGAISCFHFYMFWQLPVMRRWIYFPEIFICFERDVKSLMFNNELNTASMRDNILSCHAPPWPTQRIYFKFQQSMRQQFGYVEALISSSSWNFSLLVICRITQGERMANVTCWSRKLAYSSTRQWTLYCIKLRIRETETRDGIWIEI